MNKASNHKLFSRDVCLNDLVMIKGRKYDPYALDESLKYKGT